MIRDVLEGNNVDNLLRNLYNDCSLHKDDYAKEKKTRTIVELFLWAVLSNLPDMMEVLLLHGQGLLRKALIGEKASKLMVEFGEKRRMLDDTISQYKRNKQ